MNISDKLKELETAQNCAQKLRDDLKSSLTISDIWPCAFDGNSKVIFSGILNQDKFLNAYFERVSDKKRVYLTIDQLHAFKPSALIHVNFAEKGD